MLNGLQIRRCFLLVQQLKHPLRRGNGGLNGRGNGSRLGDWHHQLPGVGDDRGYIAQGDDHPQRPAADNPNAAQNTHSHIVQIVDNHHGRLNHAGDKRSLEGGLEQHLVLLLKGLHGGLLPAKELYHGVAGVHFLDLTVEITGGSPLCGEIALGPRCNHLGHQEAQHHRYQRDQRQQPVPIEHKEQHADQRNNRGDDLGQAHLQGHGDILHVVGHPGEDIAPGMGVKILDGQLFQLDINGLAHIVDQILRYVDHDKLLNQVAYHRQGI